MDIEQHNPHQRALATGDDSRSDRIRFQQEFDALRLTLRQQRHPFEDEVTSRAQIMRPEQLPAIPLETARRKPPPRGEAGSYFLPEGLIRGAKIVALCAVAVALYYGPPYYTCQQLKERGMFYSGTTVSSCVQEWLDARTDPFEALTTRLRTVL